ncbi:MAG: prolipoprotein diacylglyceryl transferase [Candidatus Muiribacteriota bacterium]
MYPVLFEIGGMELRTYGLFFAMTFIAAIIFGLFRAKKYNISSDEVYEFAFYIMFGAIIGAKLLSLVVDFQYIIKNGITLRVLFAGFVFYGGLIGGTLGGIAYVYKNKKNYGEFADFVAPIVPTSHAIGRFGCFFNGCCYGKTTDSVFGVVFPNLMDGNPRYPTQLFEAVFLIGLTVFLLLYNNRRKYSSHLFVIYITVYSIFRFFNEMLRGDFRGGVFGLSTSQWISIFIFSAAIIYHIKNKWKNKDEG